MTSAGVLKSSLADRLQKRDEERIQNQQNKRSEKLGNKIVEETEEYFNKKFSNMKSEIESELEDDNLLSMDDKDLQMKNLENIAEKINDMQLFFTNSTHFLSSFTMKSAQKILLKLSNSLEEKKVSCKPKKKFGFKSNKSKGIDQVDKNNTTETVNLKQKPKYEPNFDANSLEISDLKDVEISKFANETSSKDVTISNLVNCTVKLFGHPSAVNIHKLQNCKIFVGPVNGSILIVDCINSNIVAACQQMRIHKTFNTNFYIHVTSRAIVEDCKSVQFAPFNWNYPNLLEDFKASGLDMSRNNWNLVEDFLWLVSDTQSPNWSILREEDRVVSWD